MAKSKRMIDGYLLKSEVLSIIQNYIRNIQMNDYGDDNGIPQLYNVMKQIDESTPAEVEEVKHGKWVWELQGIGKMNCKCTNCQEWFPINYEDLDEYGSPERETKRCPNCGAIMEGGIE